MIHTPQRKNNEVPKSLKLQQIAELVGGELIGDREVVITGVAGIKEAGKGDITFLSNARYLPFLKQTQAAAVITSKDTVFKDKPLIRAANPSQAFNKVISFFIPTPFSKSSGVHSTAVIGKNVQLGKEVSVGPHAVVEEGASIGDNTILEAGVFIGRNTKIGKDSHVYPNVTIREEIEIGDRVIIHSGTVIGSDGFGYETIEDVHVKIPQLGSVLIESDVEIGANVCIDRGRFKKTWIKKGTKIDNLVQIAHNVVIGSNSLIVSQAGISGSAELGENVIVAGQVGIVGHVTVGDGAIIAAGAGVTKSVPAKMTMFGRPARPMAEQKRILALIARLPELFKEIAEIKKRFNERP